MSRDVRILVGLLLTLVLGTALFLAAIVAIDGGECNRADCSWVGDLANGSSASILMGAALAVAGGVVWMAGRVLGRIGILRPPRG
jgi:hypothetical protein